MVYLNAQMLLIVMTTKLKLFTFYGPLFTTLKLFGSMKTVLSIEVSSIESISTGLERVCCSSEYSNNVHRVYAI